MQKRCISALFALCLLLLSACSARRSETLPPLPTPAPPAETEEMPSPSPEQPSPSPEQPSPSPSPEQPQPVTKEEISARFLEAMSNLTEEVQLDVSGVMWQYGAENDLRNIYYGVLSEHQELKYAYDMEASVSGDTALCKFRYMPYKTGAYASGAPAGSHTVNSLRAAMVMAQSMIDGTDRISIAITDPSLLVEDLQLALAQAGYGWIHFDLNRDGTEIVAQPPVGKTLADCVTAINESFRLGGEILSEVVTAEMTQMEKAGALYDYITANVRYDFRYYSDRENMPYESTVALGALRDGLAICGGYAQAFQTLLDMAGIENYTVSGVSSGEYHMWNYVVIDGVGYYCDPTADRGGARRHFMLRETAFSEQGSYTWDPEILAKISGAAG